MRRLQGCAPAGAALTAALALGACGADFTGLAPGPLPYQHANAIVSAGYSESQIGPDRYRIEVKGPPGTPRERLEKIAATRAAEIGRDNNLGYFKIESVQHGTSCRTYTTGGKPGSPGSGATKALAQAVLTADVAYAKAPADAGYLDARATFAQYRAELDQDQAPPPSGPVPGVCG